MIEKIKQILNDLVYWYAVKNNKQKNIVRISVVIASICIGPFTLVFVATWLVPLLLYLEFQSAGLEDYPSDDSGKEK